MCSGGTAPMHLGGLALVLSRAGSSNTVHGNVVADVSGGGVEVRGPGTGNRVEDNWVHHIGSEYRGSIGIAVEDAPDATVAHNQVNAVPSCADAERPDVELGARPLSPRHDSAS
jgi:hypothetical protein